MNEAEHAVIPAAEEAAREEISVADESSEIPETAPVEQPAEEVESAAEMPPEVPENDEPEEATVSRLADEFLALAEEMEGIAHPEDLPEEVWETAAQGVPLRDAYLRFWYAEHIRRQVAANTRERTAAGSTGSLRDLPEDPRPAEAAFARSFQTAVE